MNLRQRLEIIFSAHQVGTAYLFGSQQEAGLRFLEGGHAAPKPGSDLDLGIVWQHTARDYQELNIWRDALHRDLAPLLAPFRLHLITLPEENAHVQHAAIHGTRLWAVSEAFDRDYRRQAWALYADWHSWWP